MSLFGQKVVSVHELVDDPLAALGFARHEFLIYSRPAGDCLHVIAFGRRRESGASFVTCGVGVMFPRLHGMLWPDDAGTDALPWTFGSPIHLLSQDRKYFEWKLPTRKPKTVAEEIMRRIREQGLPYLLRFSTLPEVYRTLVEPSWPAWLALDPSHRICALAAIEVASGDRATAIARLQDEIDARADDLPKYSAPLKALLKRIQAPAPR
jgi:hypothetical protein